MALSMLMSMPGRSESQLWNVCLGDMFVGELIESYIIMSTGANEVKCM